MLNLVVYDIIWETCHYLYKEKKFIFNIFNEKFQIYSPILIFFFFLMKWEYLNFFTYLKLKFKTFLTSIVSLKLMF